MTGQESFRNIYTEMPGLFGLNIAYRPCVKLYGQMEPDRLNNSVG